MEKWIGIADKLYNMQMLISAYKERAKQLKNILIILSDGQTKQYGNYKLLKIENPGNVDYSKIEFLKTIDLDKYRRPGRKSWKLISLHEKNKFMRKVDNGEKKSD